MSKASSSSSRSPVSVVWDYDNAWIPEGYDIKTLRSNIEVALQKKNPDFFIESLIAIGPKGGDKYAEICTCTDDIKFKAIPSENMRCETQGVPECYNDNPEEQFLRKTNVSDLYAMKEVYMKALEMKKNILIIAGDTDFPTVIKGLYEEKLYVMLARLENSSGEFHNKAKATWLWKSEDPNKAATTMVHGGAPIHTKG